LFVEEDDDEMEIVMVGLMKYIDDHVTDEEEDVQDVFTFS